LWINNIVFAFFTCVCLCNIDTFSEIVEGAWDLVLIDEQCDDDKDTV